MINPKTAAKQWLRHVERRTYKNQKNRENGSTLNFTIDRWESARNQFFVGRNAVRPRKLVF